MMSCLTVPDLMPPTRERGQIQLILGPMFSGKSTELMRRMKRFKIANYSCLVIKYANDTRYDKDGLATHDRQVLSAKPATKLCDLAEDAHKSEVIGIDEGQFFPDIVPFCEKMADKGKTVIVAALDGTFQRKGFGDILQLIPLAESVVKLNAVCMMCNGEAAFTKRKGSEKKVEVIGGADKYLAVCRQCYHIRSVQNSPCKENNMTPAHQENTKAGRRLFMSPLSTSKLTNKS